MNTVYIDGTVCDAEYPVQLVLRERGKLFA